MAYTMPARRTPSYTVLSGTQHVCAFDSSIAVGDLMVLVIEQVASATSPAPTGWALRASNTHNSRALFVFTKVRETDETGVTVTRSTAGAGKATIAALGSARTDPSTWVIGAIKGRAQSPADTNVQTTALSITTTQANTMVLSIFGEATTTNETATPPTVAGATFWHYAPQTQASSEIETVLLAYEEMAAAGATGNTVATYQNVQASNGAGVQIGFPGVETTAPIIPKLAAKAADGAGGIIDVGLVGYDGSAEVALAKVEYVHGGTMVPDLDRTSRVWTMGHRGGSLDYQEHSARGYVECAINHLDVLEFSVAMSSDGVLFGLHDDTLNRTSSSLGSTAVKPGDRTWAQIQALVQDLPNRGDSRFTTAPYLSLDDFVAQWANSHTLMFDPKVLSTAQRKVLMARLQQIPDYQRRVLGKYYTTGTAIADEFHAIGCKVWGYSYTADLGTFPNGTGTGQPFVVRTDSSSTVGTASKWDYLGLEYTADDRAWAAMLQVAGSKKVVAHIVPTAAAATSAVAKGARALQVSGVRSVSAAY